MQICDFKIFSYTLPLARELHIAGHSLSARDGYIIQLTDENGNIGFGETAPLPGTSTEDVHVVLEQLKGLKNTFHSTTIPNGIGTNGEKFTSLLADIPVTPSVRFGFETAVLSLKAAQTHQSFAELLDEDPHPTIVVNALLQGNRENVLQEAEKMIAQGFQTFKLKVGFKPLDEDIATINALSAMFNGRAILRLDANKSWDLEQALKLSQAIDFAVIEYIEEPLKNFMEVPKLFEETLIPVAVDESLKEHSLREIKSLDGVETVILKPTLLGGIEKVSQMAQEAHAYGLETVISSTFESEIGIRALANLAACFSKRSAVGLDTGKWFQRNTVEQPLHFERGRAVIEDFQLLNLQLNPEFIHEV